ncbi:hypothetical protein [Lacinutrix sp.]|uniref:hypothetical protein n=1 Tax=Lacinutrix sp. TaxID=1937692 RepID=UPI0030EC6CAA
MKKGGLKGRLLIGVAIAAFFLIKHFMNREENPYTGRVQSISMTPDDEIRMGLSGINQMAQQHGGLYPNEQ